MLVRATTTASSVTVALYGHTGDRVVVSDNAAREPRADGGSRISYVRRVLDGGREVRSDRDSWTYQAPLE